ncbi:MAG TPA: condensation domain-containing protein, partial [Thermoanaerobaculia bacterium]|nr:condensation domain-containing protein [Thermoanaerobaculia bacterium]
MSGMRHILDMPAEQLDSLLQARRHKAGEVEAIPRCPRQGDGGGTFPLSFAQQRLWLVHQLEPGSAAYNIPAAYRLRGPLRTGALAASFRAVARRHEVLRTTFATLPAVGEEPVQVVHAAADLPLPILDLRPLPAAAREVEAWRLAAGEARRPFDLTRGPLLRVRLLRLDEEEHALLLTFHHIVADGWSIAVLIREMGALYEAFSRDLLPMLPPLPVQYADFAVWQRHWLQEGALERQLAYWRRQLAALPALALPTDRPRPAVRDACGGQRFLHLEEAVGTALEALGLRQGATPFMTFLAAFQVLLARYSGQHDVAVGTPVAHRERSEIENLIGFFTKTLVLRADLSGDPPFRELLERVRDAALAAFAHQDVPFERLVEELQPARDAGRTPLVQTVFALQNHGAGMPGLGGLELSPLDTGAMGAMPAKFDLLLSVASSGGRWTAALEYDAGLFDAPTAGRMLGHFQVLLAGIARDPGQRLGELPLLSEAERHQLLRELAGGQDAAAVAGTLGSLHRGFEVQAGRSPDAIAVVCDGLALSYAELGRRAGRLARRLRRLGVGPEVPVGLCLERSADLVAAVLAVLAAGGAYVPLDPASPQERLAWILEDCGAPVLVTEERLLPRFGRSGGPAVVYLDSERGERDAIAREI